MTDELKGAIEHLTNHQEQLDPYGERAGVSAWRDAAAMSDRCNRMGMK